METNWSRWVVVGMALGAGVVPACAGDGDDAAVGAGAEGEACETASVGPQQLRLLTRREYDATVRDLFGDTVGGDRHRL